MVLFTNIFVRDEETRNIISQYYKVAKQEKRNIRKYETALSHLKTSIENEKKLTEDIDEKKLQTVSDLHDNIIEKYEQIKQSIVKRNTTIGRLELMIDSVPSASELIQVYILLLYYFNCFIYE